MSLLPKQRRYLRGLAHGLSPSVQVGANGLTDAVCQATDVALEAHELIKVKVGKETGIDRKEAIGTLAQRTASEAVAVIGRVWILYRPRGEDPRIQLP
ncbi:MAG: ribosome assembly RNA-binding protein YhbY [Myxococcales bacterium]|nr:ribosome assembly RNA-binding protein YhbY [Myxococcales bacterium]